MTAQQMWEQYKTIARIGDTHYDSWAFGDDADTLAALVLEGKKTATASVYELYEADGEDLPQVGEYSVILDSQDRAVCIIRDTSVTVVPFKDVDEDHARCEGEGSMDIPYWRKVHSKLFSEWMEEAGLRFTEDTLTVLERFEVVYRP